MNAARRDSAHRDKDPAGKRRMNQRDNIIPRKTSKMPVFIGPNCADVGALGTLGPLSRTVNVQGSAGQKPGQ